MAKAELNQNLSSVKEMLLDERKLVTYVSLSKEMCIHVNESKTLLGQIVASLKKTDPSIQLNINYLVSGLLDNNKAQTVVCKESEVEELKNKLKIVFYQHIYSVNVGPPIVDNVSFLALNKFTDFQLCTGLLKSQSCVKRSSEEIRGLKTNSQENVSTEQKPGISGLKPVKTEKKNNIVIDMKQVTKIQESKSEPIIKSETVSPKKETADSISHKTNGKSAPKSQKGIAGFFNKSNSVPGKNMTNGTKENEHKNNKEEAPQVKDTKVKIEHMDVDDSKKPEKEPPNKNTVKRAKKVDVDEVVSKKSDKEPPKKEAKEKNNTLNTIKKNAKVDKKRKRVLHVSDSESDDEKNYPFREELMHEQESDDEIPPTPLVNTVKITSGITNPKKKRKIVDKTYTDEDGYILTKKEEVYESCSDNEENVSVKENVQQVNKAKTEVSPPEKKTAAKNSKKKMASPQKGKQATLMSFFKKVPQK